MHAACPLAEIGALPAPRVVLVVAPDAAIGSIQQQGVVDIPPIAEQQRAGQVNAQAGTGLFHPLSGLPIGRFGQRKVFIAIGIACVEKFRQDHELCACLGCLRDQPFGARQPLRHRRGGGIKLRGGNRDLFVHDNFSVVLNLPRVDFAESAAKRQTQVWDCWLSIFSGVGVSARSAFHSTIPCQILTTSGQRRDAQVRIPLQIGKQRRGPYGQVEHAQQPGKTAG